MIDRTNWRTGFSVGFVLFVATVIAILGLFWVGAGEGFFQSQVQYHVLCPSTSGLKNGSKVYLSGVPVGSVERIHFVDDLRVSKVRVTLLVSEHVAPRIRQDSKVELLPEGLLGDVAVHISMGTVKVDALPPGEEIEFRQSTLLDSMVGQELTGSATDIMRELVVVLGSIKRGEGTIGKLFQDPGLYHSLQSFTGSLEGLTLTLDRLAKDVAEVVDHVENQEGPLGKLLFSKEYEETITRVLSASAAIAGSIEEGLDGGSLLARALRDEELGQRFAHLAERLEHGARSLQNVLALIERGEGSIGRLVHDPSIAASLKDLFLGVQDIEYMQNLIQNAELRGRQMGRTEDRASMVARLEASRARFLASLPKPGAPGEDGGFGSPVPAAADRSEDPSRAEGDVPSPGPPGGTERGQGGRP